MTYVSCTQEIEKQYKGKKFDIPISFEFCKGESLHIPTDFSKIEGWYVRLAGKTEVIKYTIVVQHIATYLICTYVDFL